jgi:hypothetical protein
MFRARLASITLAAGLGLASGCCSLSDHSLFSRFGHRSRPAPETVVGADVCTGTEGPLMQDYGPYPVPAAPAPAPVPYPGTGPQPLAVPPRLEPQPQAPVVPYQPTRNAH